MTKRFAFISPEDGGFNFITWLDGASGPEDVWRIRGGEFASYLNGVSHDREYWAADTPHGKTADKLRR